MYMHGKRPDGSADLPGAVPDKRPIVIKRGTFVGTIYDVPHLLELPLANVRKLWALMFEAAYDNEAAIATIREWLPQETTTGRDDIQRLEAELAAAKHDAEAKRRIVAAMGTALIERITIAKRELTRAKKKPLPAERIAMYQSAYNSAARPKTDHQLAEKEASRLESALKTAKAAHERAKKMQIIFNEMAAKAGI